MESFVRIKVEKQSWECSLPTPKNPFLKYKNLPKRKKKLANQSYAYHIFFKENEF